MPEKSWNGGNVLLITLANQQECKSPKLFSHIVKVLTFDANLDYVLMGGGVVGFMGVQPTAFLGADISGQEHLNSIISLSDVGKTRAVSKFLIALK